MLRQVLHNHLTTQGLTVLSAVAAVGRLLGHLAWHLHGLGYDLQRFAEDTLAHLGDQLLARLRACFEIPEMSAFLRFRGPSGADAISQIP